MNPIFNFEAGRNQVNNESFNQVQALANTYTDIAGHPNGNIYCATNNGMYIQTAGAGLFTQLPDTVRNYQGVGIARNGDVYSTIYGGDVYKQTGGSGIFTAVGAGTRNWFGCTVNNNGDVYAGVHTGDIYKQTGGVGAWVAQGAGTRV